MKLLEILLSLTLLSIILLCVNASILLAGKEVQQALQQEMAVNQIATLGEDILVYRDSPFYNRVVDHWETQTKKVLPHVKLTLDVNNVPHHIELCLPHQSCLAEQLP